MATLPRMTSEDLELFPDDGKLYEIIDGELYVSKQPHWHHQNVSGDIYTALQLWSRQTQLGRASIAPGVIFTGEDDVVPDVLWVSNDRLEAALDDAGHLHVAPDLAVEVLSPGVMNERRDREAKLKLYARRGVLEYWIVDWRTRQIEVYRRGDLTLQLVHTLLAQDTLESPMLPGFSLPLAELFADLPPTH